MIDLLAALCKKYKRARCHMRNRGLSVVRAARMWSFLADRRIPLTNNLAEQAIRSHVIWRKLAYASHSRRGDEFRARVMSVVMTGRNLGIPIYEYLRRICCESMTVVWVTTLLPLSVGRLPA